MDMIPPVPARRYAASLLLLLVCVSPVSGQEDSPDPRWNLSPEKAARLAHSVRPGRDLTPDSWPEGKKVAVALTFDLDAELVWMDDPDNTSPSDLSRGHYGPEAGLQRILNLLRSRRIPATFFMAAMILKLHPESIELIRKETQHEIGFHGYAHESVGTLTEEQEREAMQKGLEMFRSIGLRPKIYRSPSWDFSPNTLKLIKEFGFQVDSSLMGSDRPYEIYASDQPTGIVELPVDWAMDDWPYFQFEWDASGTGLRSPDDVLKIWIEEFEGARSEGGVFMLTMHPQVIGRWSRIRMLGKLIDHINISGDAWYATVSQITTAIKATPSK